MKRSVVISLCAALLLGAFLINAVAMYGEVKAAEEFDQVAALASDTDRLPVALSAIYKRAGDLVLSLPYASINLTQTAITKVYAGDEDALLYLNTHADGELGNAYDEMQDILNDFDSILYTYNVPSGSGYRDGRAKLGTIFSGLKTAATELVRRARTFISNWESGYDNYYTAYCEQLQVMSDKLESAATTIGNEYDSLIKDLLGEDYEVTV